MNKEWYPYAINLLFHEAYDNQEFREVAFEHDLNHTHYMRLRMHPAAAKTMIMNLEYLIKEAEKIATQETNST